MGRAKSALLAVHSDNASDPTILPILAVVQSNLQSETASVIDFAEANDWNALQVRLANQLRPLEFSISALVERVDREVKTEHAQAAAIFARCSSGFLLSCRPRSFSPC